MSLFSKIKFIVTDTTKKDIKEAIKHLTTEMGATPLTITKRDYTDTSDSPYIIWSSVPENLED